MGLDHLLSEFTTSLKEHTEALKEHSAALLASGVVAVEQTQLKVEKEVAAVKKAATTKAPPAKAAAAATPAKAEAKAAEQPTIKREEVFAALSKLANEFATGGVGLQAAKTIVANYGVSKMAELADEHLQAAYDEACAKFDALKAEAEHAASADSDTGL